mmetsp:Transcript_13941/g.19346  ORF Transcript_13941/g.19346 Transcript_13941/m.19346 type:complete len:218 (+) Transcript_13941:73-726(+)
MFRIASALNRISRVGTRSFSSTLGNGQHAFIVDLRWRVEEDKDEWRQKWEEYLASHVESNEKNCHCYQFLDDKKHPNAAAIFELYEQKEDLLLEHCTSTAFEEFGSKEFHKKISLPQPEEVKGTHFTIAEEGFLQREGQSFNKQAAVYMSTLQFPNAESLVNWKKDWFSSAAREVEKYEPGCITYAFLEDEADNTRGVIYERYDSESSAMLNPYGGS